MSVWVLVVYQCVDEVLQFVTDFTSYVEGVGHVCRSAFLSSSQFEVVIHG